MAGDRQASKQQLHGKRPAVHQFAGQAVVMMQRDGFVWSGERSAEGTVLEGTACDVESACTGTSPSC